MEKGRVIGAGKQVGDSNLQVDGPAEQAEGKLRNDAGNAKDTLK